MLSPEHSLGLALDATRFFEFVVGGPPDPWQAALLQSDAKRICVCASRQVGKSQSTAILCASEICFGGSDSGGDPPLVICVAPSLRQSTELARKIFEAVRAVEPDVKMQSLTRLETSRGARCIAMPMTEGVRGLSKVSLAVLDEASRIDDSMQAAVRPMLSVSNGRLILLSTPFGKRGVLWEAWSGAAGVWEKYSARADECPRISKEYLAGELLALGPFLYSQEFENAWVDSESQLISSDLILAARWQTDEKPWW